MARTGSALMIKSNRYGSSINLRSLLILSGFGGDLNMPDS